MSNKKKEAQSVTEPIPQAVSDNFDPQVVSQRLTPNLLSEFMMDKDALRLALVTAQFALRATRQQSPPITNKPTGLLVLVNGMEQAGKGGAVKQLRQWVDPRLLKVEATIGYPQLAYQPLWQAHTKSMPRHGDVMVYFGNWYADLLYHIMRLASDTFDDDNSSDSDSDSDSDDNPKNSNNNDFKIEKDKLGFVKNLPIKKWQDYLHQQLIELQDFERDLAANQTKILKCWFHVDIDTLKERLNDDEADPQFLYQIDWNDAQVLGVFNQIAATLLQQQGDWVIIDGGDKSQAATHFCHEVLHAMQTALITSSHVDTTELSAKKIDNKHSSNEQSGSTKPVTDDKASTSTSMAFTAVKIPKQLVNIKDPDMDKADYAKQLSAKQAHLAELLRARAGRHVVFAFEGMDAAGKGGAIKRLVAPLDPREYQIYNIGAPMLYELQHPYLWRFWTKLPNEQTDRISRIAIFDRTWYGRVLVERIEQLANADEWQRAYNEINCFEADLVTAGTVVIKYWLAIDKHEQLKRFEARGKTPHKQFKLTDDDWRNRDKWSDYVQAAADMLARTNTKAAPWCVVATNDKHQARLQVLDYAIEQLSLVHKPS